MQNHQLQTIKDRRESLEDLLAVEHQNLVHWLHDELGQNLVAIKSFAAAISEQNQNSGDDTAELADFIKQAADQAYRSTYDLMQELRAQSSADLPVETALATCLEESRLKEKGIDYHLEVDPDLIKLDKLTLSVILRSLRSFINFSQQARQTPGLSVSLDSLDSAEGDYMVRLRLSHQGEFELPPAESPGLQALQKRIEAIDGKMHVNSDQLAALEITITLQHPRP